MLNRITQQKIDRKGISPLIATVLIIGFTVALAAVVITWGTGFVNKVNSGTEERIMKTEACITDLNFEIKSAECPNKILLENNGAIDIDLVNLRFFDNENNFISSQEIIGVEKYNLKNYDLTLPKKTSKIEAIANVKTEKFTFTCSENIKKREISPAC